MAFHYGHFVVVLSFGVHFVVYGMAFSVGVWNTVFLEQLGQSHASTAILGSLLNAMLFINGFISSYLIDTFGCRVLVIAGGILTEIGLLFSTMATSLHFLMLSFSMMVGTGIGISFLPSIVIVEQYFQQKATFPIGVAASGLGVGTILFPFVTEFFLSILSWRSALMANALVSSILLICGLLMKDLDLPSSRLSSQPLWNQLRQFSSTQKLALAMFGFNNLFYLSGISIVMMHVVAFVDKNGIISQDHYPMIISFIGLCNLLGRIVLGFICQWKACSSTLVYVFSNVVSGLAILLIVFKVQTCVYLGCALFGFFSGCIGPMIPDILIQLLGRRSLALGYGILLLFEATGSFGGPLLAGYLVDIHQSYERCFYLAGGSLALAAVFMLLPWGVIKSMDRYQIPAQIVIEEILDPRLDEEHSS
ncbi:hypothetical protein TCAL_01742 [Tigriopus californicus]|uniref:Major facilitator superfamily (MFS) profile domain-containing protein n=1 Tax=Tigriopus californicus TaxID=6832 RepID=A0A553PM80_TIGCA|nr:hypothetical protein TCAL_01742 [Tigriopus californicus]